MSLPSGQSAIRDEGWLRWLFGASLFYALWALSVGWNHSILGLHGFRQTLEGIGDPDRAIGHLVGGEDAAHEHHRSAAPHAAFDDVAGQSGQVEIPHRRVQRVQPLNRRGGAVDALAIERDELLVEVRVGAFEEQDDPIAVDGALHYNLLGGHVRTGR